MLGRMDFCMGSGEPSIVFVQENDIISCVLLAFVFSAPEYMACHRAQKMLLHEGVNARLPLGE